MKTLKTTLAALLITAAILPCVSCKKESTTTPTPKSAQEKLLGKWNMISEVYNDYYGGSSHITTYNFPAGDYLDFKSNGKVNSYQGGSTSTFDYGFINESKIWFGFLNNIFDLKLLTDTDLQMYKKDVTGADYHESTLNLKR